MDFTGKTAIITGATAGLGRAVAGKMAAGHAAPALIDADADGLHALCEELTSAGTTVYEYVCSMADEQGARQRQGVHNPAGNSTRIIFMKGVTLQASPWY